MFPVEILVEDQQQLIPTMADMRTWLDHQHFEPTTFRYTFGGGGIVIRVDFSAEAQASAFADSFRGALVAAA